MAQDRAKFAQLLNHCACHLLPVQNFTVAPSGEPSDITTNTYHEACPAASELSRAPSVFALHLTLPQWYEQQDKVPPVKLLNSTQPASQRQDTLEGHRWDCNRYDHHPVEITASIKHDRPSEHKCSCQCCSDCVETVTRRRPQDGQTAGTLLSQGTCHPITQLTDQQLQMLSQLRTSATES